MLSKEYLAHPAMSQSKLKRILKGPQEFTYWASRASESSDSQDLGNAVHLLVLEPHKSDKIVVLPKINGATRKGKIFNFLQAGKQPSFFRSGEKTDEVDRYEVSNVEYDWMMSQHSAFGHVFANPDQFLILDEETHHKAICMAQAVRNNPTCAKILAACTSFEKNHYFDYMGIRFKCQLDGEGIWEGAPFVLDLKTSAMKAPPHIDNEDFASIMEYEIKKWGYHFQAVPYLKTIKQDFMCDIVPIYFIPFVRSEAPYQVYPIMMSQKLINLGNMEFDRACVLYKEYLDLPHYHVFHNQLRVV